MRDSGGQLVLHFDRLDRHRRRLSTRSPPYSAPFLVHHRNPRGARRVPHARTGEAPADASASIARPGAPVPPGPRTARFRRARDGPRRRHARNARRGTLAAEPRLAPRAPLLFSYCSASVGALCRAAAAAARGSTGTAVPASPRTSRSSEERVQAATVFPGSGVSGLRERAAPTPPPPRVRRRPRRRSRRRARDERSVVAETFARCLRCVHRGDDRRPRRGKPHVLGAKAAPGVDIRESKYVQWGSPSTKGSTRRQRPRHDPRRVATGRVRTGPDPSRGRRSRSIRVQRSARRGSERFVSSGDLEEDDLSRKIVDGTDRRRENRRSAAVAAVSALAGLLRRRSRRKETRGGSAARTTP